MHRSTRRIATTLVFGLLSPCLFATSLLAETTSAKVDWPGLRGPHYDGSALADASLFRDADSVGLEVTWKVELGYGYSGLAAGGGRVFTGFTAGDSDVIAAFSTADGAEIWRYRIGEKYAGHDGSTDGPIATPALADGRVIGLAPRGELFALDAATGAEIWRTHLAEDQGGSKPFYGFSSSPVVVDGTVVVHLGAEEGPALVGFDAATGERRWTLGAGGANYQSPVVATLGGVRQVVAASDTTLYGFDPSTGSELWSYEHGGDGRAMSSGSMVPVPIGDDRVFMNHAMNASAVLRITPAGEEWTIEEVWSDNILARSYVIPVEHDGALYGVNGNILTAVDAATGERLWRSREPGDGFVTRVGDHLAIQTKSGSLHVAETSPEGYVEVASLEIFESNSWAAPTWADGALFVRSMDGLARVDPTKGDGGASDSGEIPSWLATTELGRFLAEVAAAENEAAKSALVDTWLEKQESFPIVEATGVVHFVYRGDAEDVGIIGDMIGFRREDPMTRVPGTDLFYYSMRLEPDAALSYGFIPSYGEPIADPRNPETDRGLFGEVSFLAMPAWEPAIQPEGEVEAERLVAVEWESEVLEMTRELRVYLPPGFDATANTRYPVAYYHGLGAEGASGVAGILDTLVGETVEPLIVVFVLPHPEGGERDMFQPQGYLQMFTTEVLPKIDAEYPTIPERWARATMGVAEGGNGALHSGFRFPELFGKIGSLAAMLMSPNELDDALGDAEERTFVIWHGWDTYHLRSPHEGWDMAESARRFHQVLRERGYRPTGGEAPGGFGWKVWSARVDEGFEALFPSTASR